MRITFVHRGLRCLASVFIAGLLFVGCQQQEEHSATPTPAVAGTFTGQDLPSKVEELNGTPLYSVSKELTGVAKLEGATYLLIAPQDPTKALLVQEKGATPESLSGRESKPIKISGAKTTTDSADLVKHVKERYEMDLQVDDAGKVVVLQVVGPTESGSNGE